jgi:hypothetical protein
MGYYARGNGSVRIRVADLDDAFRAMMSTLSETPWFAEDTMWTAGDLDGLLADMFGPDETSREDDVDVRVFTVTDSNVKVHRSLSDVLEVLAPWVLSGDFDFRGEDGDLWRYAFADGDMVYQHAEFDDELMQQARVTLREIAEFAESEHATCRECSAYLPADDEHCPTSEDGQHEPDMVLSDPPEDEPTRDVTVQFKIRVPNDDYDYHVDISGRLEWMLSLMLLHPLVTSVETSGPSGSGWVAG